MSIDFCKGNAITLVQCQKAFRVAFAHGCNCFCAMGAGIALEVKKKLPALYQADCRGGQRGDRRKLGSFTKAHFPWGVGYNLYTQFTYHNPRDMVAWDKLEQCFKGMFHDMREERIHIVVMPRICSGLAKGHLTESEAWGRVEEALRCCPADMRVMVVDFDPNAPSEWDHHTMPTPPPQASEGTAKVAITSNSNLSSRTRNLRAGHHAETIYVHDEPGSEQVGLPRQPFNVDEDTSSDEVDLPTETVSRLAQPHDAEPEDLNAMINLDQAHSMQVYADDSLLDEEGVVVKLSKESEEGVVDVPVEARFHMDDEECHVPIRREVELMPRL